VLAALGEWLKPLSANDIAMATGRTRNAIDSLLHRMVTDGEVERAGRGRYVLPADSPHIPIHEFRWADGMVVARFRPNICKNERLGDQDADASKELRSDDA
jgi:hypothetical protein